MIAQQDQQRQGASDPAVAVLEGVDLDEPVMEPRGADQRVRIGGLPVERHQPLQLALHVFGWRVLQHGPVRTPDVIRLLLPFAVAQWPLEHPAELISGLVGVLVPSDDLMQLPYQIHRQLGALLNQGREELQRVVLIPDDLERLRRDTAGTVRHLHAEAFGNQHLGGAPVKFVQPLDDAGFHGMPAESPGLRGRALLGGG